MKGLRKTNELSDRQKLRDYAKNKCMDGLVKKEKRKNWVAKKIIMD